MKKPLMRLLVFFAIIIVISVSAYEYSVHANTQDSAPVMAYSADAYVQETQLLLSRFHNQTGASIAPVKSGGSLTDAREIGQGSPSNVFITVSLNSLQKSYLKSSYSGWGIAFASDQMVLAYSNSTHNTQATESIIKEFRYAGNSSSYSSYNGAFTNLTSGKVRLGIANPESDPAGFRGWISLEIAGYLFHNNETSYFEKRAVSHNATVSATDAASLVSPLESGQIQFLFIYKSAAEVKGLNYVQLPPKMNLGSPRYAGFYSNFSYNLTSGSVSGAPIYLYITALGGPNSSVTPLLFTEFVISNSALLKPFGLAPIVPALIYNDTAPPPGIENMVVKGEIAYGGHL